MAFIPGMPVPPHQPGLAFSNVLLGSPSPGAAAPPVDLTSSRTPKTSRNVLGTNNPYLPASWYPSANAAPTGIPGLPATTAAGNLAAGPDLATLTQLIDSINQSAQQTANQSRIPNNPALEAQSSANIGSELSGTLPPDVTRLLGQQAAERGVSIGSPGSDNANADLFQSLGLTSLGLEQQGQTNLTAADARNPTAPLFDPSNQLLTPSQAGNLALGQNQNSLDFLRQVSQPARTGTGGGGGSPTGGTATTSPGSQDNSWWNSLFPADASAVNPAGSTLYNYDSGQYPGTSVPGLPDLSSILGPYNPPPDNTTTTDTSSTYDPFSQYVDFSSGG